MTDPKTKSKLDALLPWLLLLIVAGGTFGVLQVLVVKLIR